MVRAFAIDVGDEVRDAKLGLIWTIVGRDGEGGLLIRRNGVIASASIWDLDLSPRARCLAAARTKNQIPYDLRQIVD